MIGIANKDMVAVLGYDEAKGKDFPALVIGKRVNGKTIWEKVIYGDKAIREYSRLKGI